MSKGRINLIKTLLANGMTFSQVVTLVQIQTALRECRSVLDVGCGYNSPLRLFGFQSLVGLEGYGPSVETATKNRTHDQVVLDDVRHLDRHFEPGQFDACVALDLIEHLTKHDGLELAMAMDRVAARKVVLLTPNGFLPQHHAERADLQEHLSGWTPAEMRRLGYHVAGALGPKFLRGEYHRLRFKPAGFWALVSLAGHFFFTRWMPSRAAAILCVKTK